MHSQRKADLGLGHRAPRNARERQTAMLAPHLRQQIWVAMMERVRHRRYRDDLGRFRPATRKNEAMERRERLKPKRSGFTQEARIDSKVTVCVHTGEYDDGRLGEVFIDISSNEHEGLRAWANNFAILLSHALQYGMPLDALVEQFIFTRFEPCGVVEGDDNVKMCTSVLDYVFRVLGVHYLRRDELAQKPPQRGVE